MGATSEMIIQNKSLYEINESQQFLISQIEDLEGEITPEMEQQLEITKSCLNQKSMAYLQVIKHKEGFNDLIDAEIKRLQALKKRNTNIVSRLNSNLLSAVKTFGVYEVGLQKFGIKKSESIEVEFINELPEEFKTRKLTETANKIALKKAIKEGKEIEGVTLKTNYNLKIN